MKALLLVALQESSKCLASCYDAFTHTNIAA